jgi:hypothetical protein
VADSSDVFAALKSAALTALYPPSLTVGGSAAAGDVLSVTATPAQGGPAGEAPRPIVFSYTAAAGDSPATMAYWLFAAFQAAAPLFCGLTATLAGATIAFAATPGVWTLSSQITGAASETLTVTTVPATGISPIAGAQVLAVSGWPTANDLDAVAASPAAVTTGSGSVRAIVSVFAPPGYYRNTTRYPLEWQVLAPPAKTLTATVTGNTVTIGGAGGPPQTVALIVGAGARRRVYAYPAQSWDTPASVAAGLAALVNADAPALVSGATLAIPGAFDLTARVGGQGAAIKEIARQVERFQMHVWAPSPAVRDAIGAPLRQALADTAFLTLADGTAARLVCCGDSLLDDPEKAGLYRRTLLLDIEYATTITQAAAEITVFEAKQQTAAAEITVFEAKQQTAQVPAAAPANTVLDTARPASGEANQTMAAVPEAFVELGPMTSYTLPDGLVPGQRVLITDNFGTAAVVHPVVYAKFDLGPSFVLTQNFQSIEPVWDGAQWVMA